MKNIKTQQIKAALETELMYTETPKDIWSGIASTLPHPQEKHVVRRHFPLTATLVIVFVLSTTGIALASTPYGNEVVNLVMQKFGIHLVTNTPQLRDEMRQKGAEAVLHGTLLQENMDKIPAGMKLPSYLPESLKGPETRASIYDLQGGAGIRWSIGDEQFVEVWFHSHAFGKGSTTITNGDASEVQEVKIGDLPAMVFHDNNGWNLELAMDGHQYTIMTSISLAEAIKVAESIK